MTGTDAAECSFTKARHSISIAEYDKYQNGMTNADLVSVKSKRQPPTTCLGENFARGGYGYSYANVW